MSTNNDNNRFEISLTKILMIVGGIAGVVAGSCVLSFQISTTWGFMGLITVSIISITLFVFNLALCITSKNESQISAWAGLCAGIVILTIYIIWPPPNNFSISEDVKWILRWALIGIGWAVGLLIILLVKLLRRTRAIGLITLALTVSSTIAFYSFVTLGTFQELALFTSLGMALGIFSASIIFPSSVFKLFDS
jgi:hypothetical protein